MFRMTTFATVFWMALLGRAWATSGISQPTSPQIRVTVTGLDKNEVGEVAELRFEVTAGMPFRAPKNQSIYGQPSDTPSPTPGKLGPRWIDESRLDLVVVSVPNTVRLTGTGYIVIAPGQPMPFGVPFQSDRLRLVFPLYLPEAGPTGSLIIRPLAAGAFRLNVSLLSVNTTGSLLGEKVLFNQLRDLRDHSPVIVVQDRFTAPKPDAIFLASSGRHELWVYKQRFDVYSVKSGGLILSRVGTDPRFSPTGRFLTYDDGQETVVVDVLDRRNEFAVANRILVAFFAGDAYLYAHRLYGMFYFESPFVDDNYDPSSVLYRGPSVAPAPGHRNQAKGWNALFESSCSGHGCFVLPTSIRLDMSRGLLVVDPKLDHPDYDSKGHEIPQDLEHGRRTHDFFSLLTGDAWENQTAASPTFAAALSDLFAHPNQFGLTRNGEFHRDQTKDVVPMRALNAGRFQKPVIANRGQPVFRTLHSPSTEIRPSSATEVREFLYNRGFEFLPAFRADETGHKWSSYFDDPRGHESAAEHEALLKRLGDGHETLLEPVTKEAHETVGDPAAEGKIALGTVPSKPLDKPLDVQYKVWKTSWGRVVSLAEVSGPGGSEGLLDLDLCLFAIRKTGSAPSDSGRCFSQSNFNPKLAWMKLTPVGVIELTADRFAAIAIDLADRILIVDIQAMKIIATVDGAVETGSISYLGVSSDGKLLLQCNRDGKLFVYNMGSGKRVLSGISVDNEVVLFDDNGYYDSTPEGAHYVYWLFPGLGEHFAFSQFQSRMHRPDVMLALLRGGGPKAEPLLLDAPPRVDLKLLTLRPDNHGQIRIHISAQSQTGLKTVRLFVDGVPLDEIQLSGRTAAINRSMPIAQGIHWVTTVAYDASGYSSVPKSARVNGAGSPLSKGRLFYVGVAVDQYPGIPNGSLRYAKRDMQLLAETLRVRAGAQYSDIQTTLLADALATPEAIIAALQQATSSAKPEDTLIVSFAGHGVAGSDGRFFFLTSAATTGELTSGALDWARAASVLAESRAKVFVLLDACHSGFASQETVVPNDAYAAALMRNSRAGMAVLAASKGREFSQERAELEGGHGLFSYAVARALDKDRNAADWQQAGIIDLDELYRYVKNYVSQMTGESQMPQTPWLSRDELIGEVPVL